MKFKYQAELLTFVREEMGYSQKDLAEELQTTPQFICNIENGRAGIPVSIAVLLSSLCDKDLYYFKRAFLADMESRWDYETENLR